MKLGKIYTKIGNKSQSNQGFTFIELLVVMIIIGILSAISIPSLLGNVGKSRESEAKINLGILSRSQQTYHLENREFADTISKLTTSLTLNTQYYNFLDPGVASNILVKHQAIPLDVSTSQVRNYASGVYFDPLNGNFLIVICKGDGINSAVDAPNTFSDSCTNGGKKIK